MSAKGIAVQTLLYAAVNNALLWKYIKKNKKYVFFLLRVFFAKKTVFYLKKQTRFFCVPSLIMHQ